MGWGSARLAHAHLVEHRAWRNVYWQVAHAKVATSGLKVQMGLHVHFKHAMHVALAKRSHGRQEFP